MRKQLVNGKKLLLFVDTGDNCRCPLAIGYLTKLLSQKKIDYIDLKHMGVMTPNDLLPTPEVVQLLKEEGIDIKYHRSRPVDDKLIRAADIVFGFTAIHVQTCLRRVPESKHKTFLLKEYVGLGQSGDQIHDPMGSTMEIFKKYFAEIKQSLHKLVEMEFITTPPEPKEVVIAQTVSKPRQTDDEDDIMSARRDDSRRAKAKRPAKSEADVAEDSDDDSANVSTADAQSNVVASAKRKNTDPDSVADKSTGKKIAGKVKPEPARTAKAEKPAPAEKAGNPKETVKPERKEGKPAVKKTAAAKAKVSPKTESVDAAIKPKKSKK